MSKTTLSERYLQKTWRAIDWDSVQAKLDEYQRELYIAQRTRDYDLVIDIESKLVDDLDIRCLAVRHVADSKSGPGVDKVRWKTDAEKMRAAFELNSRGYKAHPYRQILLTTKYGGKERRAGLPTYHDRAMSKLYAYVLAPLSEAHADKKSFAFREGRSALDALEYVAEGLKDPDSPQVVVVADVQSFYASIEHDWIMRHVPINKHVLHEFLESGIVFAGALFESDSVGISEGSNLSPYIGNYVLDGLQGEIYSSLHGTTHPKDYADGNFIRFADDIVVTVRSFAKAEQALDTVRDFLAERGLSLSPRKTHIRSVYEGFTFLSQAFRKDGDRLIREPSQKTVQNKKSECVELIENWTRSQRALIEKLNAKLTGWANYHRFCDARNAFREVDIAIQTALLEAHRKKSPSLTLKKIIEKYWVEDTHLNGHYYCLPSDPSVRLVRLTDTLLMKHDSVSVSVSPYMDRAFKTRRQELRQIENVSGSYKALWKRQKGRCYYCGHRILLDQAKSIVQKDLGKARSIDNSAYIHKMCELSDFEVVEMDEDVSHLRPYDVLETLEWLSGSEKKTEVYLHLPKNWKYQKLMDYFHATSKAKFTLTFLDIEKIIDSELPPTAYKHASFWNDNTRYPSIGNCWIRQGYEKVKLDLMKQKVSFRRKEDHLVPFQIPRKLLDRKIPEDAEFKLQQVCAAIIREYKL